MTIINNREFYFTKKQVKRFLNLFDRKYIPERLIIYEKRIDLFRKLGPVGLSLFEVLFGRTEGTYNPSTDTICVFVFSESDDGDDKQSFQLYALHALCHELRHRFQYKTNTLMTEEDADCFATEFMDKHSYQIRKIMKWEDEWEIEEY